MKFLNIKGGISKRGEIKPEGGGGNEFESMGDTQEGPFWAF